MHKSSTYEDVHGIGVRMKKGAAPTPIERQIAAMTTIARQRERSAVTMNAESASRILHVCVSQRKPCGRMRSGKLADQRSRSSCRRGPEQNNCSHNDLESAPGQRSRTARPIEERPETSTSMKALISRQRPCLDRRWTVELSELRPHRLPPNPEPSVNVMELN